MSVAKNTACQAAFEATIKDRVRTIEEAGLTAEVAALTKQTFVVNWDNDNILTWKCSWETRLFQAQAFPWGALLGPSGRAVSPQHCQGVSSSRRFLPAAGHGMPRCVLGAQDELGWGCGLGAQEQGCGMLKASLAAQTGHMRCL